MINFTPLTLSCDIPAVNVCVFLVPDSSYVTNIH